MGCDGSHFSLKDLLPGNFLAPPLPPDDVQKPKQTNNIYCPTQECLFLEFHLNEWLMAVYTTDPFCCSCPPDLILSDMQHTTLTRTNPSKLESLEDITVLLEESDEWGTEWAVKVFEVITQFNQEYASIMEKSTTQQKQKQK
jgi:hypothetical protein